MRIPEDTLPIVARARVAAEHRARANDYVTPSSALGSTVARHPACLTRDGSASPTLGAEEARNAIPIVRALARRVVVEAEDAESGQP